MDASDEYTELIYRGGKRSRKFGKLPPTDRAANVSGTRLLVLKPHAKETRNDLLTSSLCGRVFACYLQGNLALLYVQLQCIALAFTSLEFRVALGISSGSNMGGGGSRKVVKWSLIPIPIMRGRYY
ncbi:hypothetical protein Mapa_015775 [Marchantia paleacea]|nr:hypothetical protein Mapa_015775 [Marchantia paleacea]